MRMSVTLRTPSCPPPLQKCVELGALILNRLGVDPRNLGMLEKVKLIFRSKGISGPSS